MNIFNWFKNLLYPNKIKCIVCNEELFTSDAFCICPHCIEKLPFLDDNICKICGVKITGTGKLCERCVNNEYKEIKLARSVFTYDKSLKTLIRQLKYDNKKFIAEPLSNILYNYYIHHSDPLHKNRLKERGFNQTELLLNSFKNTHKVNTKVIERVKDTPTQTKLTTKERLENLQDAFKIINIEDIKDKNILIVDDIFTTGATCLSIAKLLVKNKAKSVKCLTLCHTSKKEDFNY